MRGSVRKRGSTWSYIIDIGKIDGKRKQKEKGGFKTQKEAQISLTAVLNELNHSGNYIGYKKITFEELFINFMEKEAKTSRRHATIIRYHSIYDNHLSKEFGHQYLHAIRHNDLQLFLNDKLEKYSTGYVKSIYNLLCVLFGYAIRRLFIIFFAPTKLRLFSYIVKSFNVAFVLNYKLLGKVFSYAHDDCFRRFNINYNFSVFHIYLIFSFLAFLYLAKNWIPQILSLESLNNFLALIFFYKRISIHIQSPTYCS